MSDKLVPVPMSLLLEIDAALMRGRNFRNSATRKAQDRLIRLIRLHYEPVWKERGGEDANPAEDGRPLLCQRCGRSALAGD